jgi:hypothetical protein
MTRAAIEARVNRYLHRTDFTQDDFTDAFNVTNARLGQELRSVVNQVELVLSGYTLPYPLPADFRELNYITVATNGGVRTLESSNLDWNVVAQRIYNSGSPWYYAVINGALEFAPATTPDAKLYYWQEPAALVAPEDTNPVMDMYPELYRYGVAAELSLLTQDPELMQGYGSLFDSRIESINYQSRMARVASRPTMRAS